MILPPIKRILLFPFEKLYSTIVLRRRAWYEARPEKRYKAPVKVISVGNISMGGTGKTPFSMWLMEQAVAAGKRPAYLSRGYGRKTSGYLRIGEEMTAREAGDEALMVSRRFPDLPVAVCESRTEGIQRLLEEDAPDLIILDDAFQHLKVHRDLDLVLMDASRMPDEDYPLPGGRLREPLFALSKADALIVGKIQTEQDWNRIKVRLAPWGKPVYGSRMVPIALHSVEGEVTALPGMAGEQAILFSGLGNNASFRAMVSQLGMNVIHQFSYRDHQRYSASMIAEIRDMVEQYPEARILTSEKDLHRLAGISLPESLHARIQAVRIGLEWMGESPTALVGD